MICHFFGFWPFFRFFMGQNTLLEAFPEKSHKRTFVDINDCSIFCFVKIVVALILRKLELLEISNLQCKCYSGKSL